MIPVEVTQTPWQFTTVPDALDHWQTLIAGVLAFVAGVGTVVAAIGAIRATRSTAREQIAASREEADKQIAASREEASRVIAATRDQTEATFKQTETTVRLEELRKSSESLAFRAMLAAAMTRVINEATWAKKTYPRILAQNAGYSDEAGAVRRCITKGAFTELRAACVRQGGPLTGEFLDLEREIDSFAGQNNTQVGLAEQLVRIEMMAAALSDKAIQQLR